MPGPATDSGRVLSASMFYDESEHRRAKHQYYEDIPGGLTKTAAAGSSLERLWKAEMEGVIHQALCSTIGQTKE